MGTFPYSSIPPEFEREAFTAKYMEELRKIVSAIQLLGQSVIVRAGTGSPQNVLAAHPGSLFLRTDGPPALYVKETGTSTTGWVPK